MANYPEQITAFEARRASTVVALEAIMTKAANEGATLDAAQQEEYDNLQADVEAIDKHLTRLKAMEALTAKSATPVAGNTPQQASDARAGRIEVKNVNLPKGTAFTRYVKALATARGNAMQAAEMAKQWRESTPEVEVVLKSAVAAGTTTDSNWAKPLVEYQNMIGEFAELLRPATIIGRIPGIRRVPFNIKIPRQTSGSSVNWVGEAKPKPVSALAFDQITLGTAKAAGIVVITEELARASSPDAEAVVRQDLIAQTAQFLDLAFVDPSKAAVNGVSPASITNGVTPIIASGNTADDLRADAKAAIAAFLTANMSLAGACWIMTETELVAISLLTNALGQPEFPGLGLNDDGTVVGRFMGLPVIASENIPAQSVVVGPPAIAAGSRILLVKANEILLADDGQTVVDVSREASLQMDSSPDSPATASTVFVSLWQQNMVGIRAERWINWAKRRANVVQMITGTNYGG